MLHFLNGRKTYLVAAVGALVGVLYMFGFEVPGLGLTHDVAIKLIWEAVGLATLRKAIV